MPRYFSKFGLVNKKINTLGIRSLPNYFIFFSGPKTIITDNISTVPFF